LPLPDDPPRDRGGRAGPLGGTLSQAISWAIVAGAAVASAAVFVAVDSHSHSASDTFYGMVVPESVVVAVAAAALLLVRARRDSAP
jgi:hypothetical protein